MKNIPLLIFILAAICLLTTCKSEQNNLPNIVIIFTDDQGYGDIGCFGAVGYRTPHLDQLAEDGMRFTYFYTAQAVCSASRAGLMTGCYPNRIGISGALFPDSKVGINPDEETIAELLKKRDYATAIFGKWHLGHHREFLPLQNGFDEYFGLPYSNDMWPVNFDGKPATDSTASYKLRYPPLPLIEGNEKVSEVLTLADQDRLTTEYTERAVSFINRNREKPFFLYLAHSMPHIPLGVSELFRGSTEQGMYGDVMEEIDWSVGRIIEALKNNDLQDNTLIIFTSDNGPWLNFGNHAGSTGGLKEGKGTSWEGGQRVPSIMSWPGVIPEGTICNEIASTIDILPTIAAITGIHLSGNRIDGLDISPLLYGEEGAAPRKQFYYYYSPNRLQGVRKGNWKLVLPHPYNSYESVLPGNDGWPGPQRHTEAEMGLYDLRRDPGERYDVSELYPEKVRELMMLVDEARSDLGDELTGIEGKNTRPPGRIGN